MEVLTNNIALTRQNGQYIFMDINPDTKLKMSLWPKYGTN